MLLTTMLFPCLVHSLVFAHSRYHLPIMPMVLLYAAAAIPQAPTIWRRRRQPAFWVASGLCLLLVLGWLRELIFVDLTAARGVLG